MPCPVCGGNLKPRGWPKRKYVAADGSECVVRVRRLRCDDCNTWHRELPDFIVPYKRHCLETIELIITNKETETCTELSTSYRIKYWWVLILDYIIGVLESIKEKYGVTVSPKENMAKIVRAVVNANLWPRTRSVLVAEP